MWKFKKSLALALMSVLCLNSLSLFAQTEATSQTDVKDQAANKVHAEATATSIAQEETSESLKLDVDVTPSVAVTPIDDDPQPVSPPPTASPRPNPGKFALTFDDLKFDMEKTEKFDREMLTPEIVSYHGGKVKIRGFIRPNFKQSGITKFIFVRDNKECCFGPQASIFDNILVRLERGKTTDYTVRPVTVEGNFVLKEYYGEDGDVWSLYRMYNAEIR